MKTIDVKNWKRRVPYENFIGYTNPIFSLATRLDVTELYNRCKAKHTSFFTDFLYIVTTCMNKSEDFRLRLKDGSVVEYETVHPNYIVMTDDGVIETCHTDAADTYAEFYKNVRADIERTKSGAKKKSFNVSGDNDCFYVSCMPWVDLIGVMNPYDYKNPDNCSIPRLTWSKYSQENGRMKMTLDVAAHHALLDGEPVCRLFNDIQNMLNGTDKVFG